MPDLRNGDPPLDDACSVGGAGVSRVRWVQVRWGVHEGGGGAGRWHRWWSWWTGSEWAEKGGDDTVGHRVELGNGCTHCGRQVSVFFLVTLRPDAAQAVKGHHFDKELLRQIRHEWNTSSDADVLKCSVIRPTESNRVNCSATSLTGKSLKSNLASSLVSPLSSWSLNSCCEDWWLTSDADWLQSDNTWHHKRQTSTIY